MATLEEVLKKLNKGKAEEDKIKKASDIETLDKEFLSSGSAYLDYYMDGKVIPFGAMTLYTGWEGSGKSSMALIAAKEAQIKYPDKTVIYLDGEQTITDSHLKRFGVNKDKFIPYQESVLEDMLDIAEEFSRSEDVSCIIIDSVKAFFSKVVEEKSAEDYTIGVEAKKLGTRFPIIHSNCARRGIAFIVLNQWRENPGVMHGDTKVLPGGQFNKYMPFTHIDFTKKEHIREDKKVVGHKLDVRIRKSKAGAYDKKEIVTLNFYYEGGFNEIDEYAQIFLEKGIAKAAGAWISFPNKDAEDVSVNGLAKFIEYLKNNTEDYEYLKTL